jgi:hypothetical protein
MAKKHDIDIKINSDGEVQLSVSGFDGPDCVKLTEDIENELGVVILREKKSEFYKQGNQSSTQINVEK